MGIHAVVAYVESQGTYEIAIRLALGARRADVVALVPRLGLRPVGIGVAAGLVLSVGLAYVIRSALFGISPFDLSAFASASAVLVAVAACAVLLPALRACRADPAMVLRSPNVGHRTNPERADWQANLFIDSDFDLVARHAAVNR